MRIADGFFTVGEQHASLFQGLNHTRVRVFPFAILIDDTSAFEAGGVFGVEAIFIDGGWNVREVLAILFSKRSLISDPNIVVIRAMRGCSVDEASTCIVGDVITVQEWNDEPIT